MGILPWRTEARSPEGEETYVSLPSSLYWASVPKRQAWCEKQRDRSQEE